MPRFQTRVSPPVWRFIVLGCLAGVVGCSPAGPAMGKVSGRITLDGLPVAKAAVTFVPQSGGRPAMGITDENGNYKLTSFADGDGAVTGRYKVTMVKQELSGTTADVKGLSGGMAPDGLKPRWIIPQRYGAQDTSELSADVKAGENRVDFDLTTSPADG